MNLDDQLNNLDEICKHTRYNSQLPDIAELYVFYGEVCLLRCCAYIVKSQNRTLDTQCIPMGKKRAMVT